MAHANPDDYFTELEANCPFGSLIMWKAIKGLIYSGAAFAAAVIAIQTEGNPTIIYTVFGALLALFFVGEAAEIRLAKWTGVIFNRRDEED